MRSKKKFKIANSALHRSVVASMFVIAAIVMAACSPAGTATPTVAPTVSLPTEAPTVMAPTTEPTMAATAAATMAGTAMPTEAATSSATLAATQAPAASVAVNVSNNATLGNILVDGQGRTLYTYANDASGVSNCSGTCAQNWPPLTIVAGNTPTAGTGVTGTLAVITRADGSSQVTYNGKPLYYYKGDANPGDSNGQGIGSVWYAATP